MPLVHARIRGVGQQAANHLAANPTGSSIPMGRSHTEDTPTCTSRADAKQKIYREMTSSPSACRPFTSCDVEELLVDVAPIGRPTLITGHDARFCVTAYLLSFFSHGAWHSPLSRSFLYSHFDEGFKTFMPFASLGSPAHRLVLRIEFT